MCHDVCRTDNKLSNLYYLIMSMEKCYNNHTVFALCLFPLSTRCTRGDARSFFCTYKTYLYAQN